MEDQLYSRWLGGDSGWRQDKLGWVSGGPVWLQQAGGLAEAGMDAGAREWVRKVVPVEPASRASAGARVQKLVARHGYNSEAGTARVGMDQGHQGHPGGSRRVPAPREAVCWRAVIDRPCPCLPVTQRLVGWAGRATRSSVCPRWPANGACDDAVDAEARSRVEALQKRGRSRRGWGLAAASEPWMRLVFTMDKRAHPLPRSQPASRPMRVMRWPCVLLLVPSIPCPPARAWLGVRPGEPRKALTSPEAREDSPRRPGWCMCRAGEEAVSEQGSTGTARMRGCAFPTGLLTAGRLSGAGWLPVGISRLRA